MLIKRTVLSPLADGDDLPAELFIALDEYVVADAFDIAALLLSAFLALDVVGLVFVNFGGSGADEDGDGEGEDGGEAHFGGWMPWLSRVVEEIKWMLI